MAIGDIKTFNITYPGLTLEVIAVDLGNGQVSFEIKCLSGFADINAIYWGDGNSTASQGTMTGFDGKKDSALNMNGSGQAWDGGMKLSSPGLGPQGRAKPTALEAGESLNQMASLDFNSLNSFGLRATSTSTAGGSIKGVDTGADVTPAPEVSVNDAECVIEGTTATFTISLAQAYAYDVYVTYSTADGSAVTGSDYDATSGVVKIAAGQTSVAVSVETNDDTISEFVDENFTLNLTNVRIDLPGANDLNSSVANDFIGDGSGEACIEDDDPLEVRVGDSCVVEGQIATFTVTLATAAAYDVWVQYHTEGGTATEGADYTGKEGWVKIAAGSTTAEILIDTTDDLLDEGDDTEAAAESYSIIIDQVSVDLNGNGNDSGDLTEAAFIVDGTGDGCIVDNDAPPIVLEEDHFPVWNQPSISHVTFYFDTPDDPFFAGDTAGLLTPKPKGNGENNDPDGWFTVKFDDIGAGATEVSDDLDDWVGDALDLIYQNYGDLSDVLAGVAIKGGSGTGSEVFYALDNDPDDTDQAPSVFVVENKEVDVAGTASYNPMTDDYEFTLPA